MLQGISEFREYAYSLGNKRNAMTKIIFCKNTIHFFKIQNINLHPKWDSSSLKIVLRGFAWTLFH